MLEKTTFNYVCLMITCEHRRTQYQTVLIQEHHLEISGKPGLYPKYNGVNEKILISTFEKSIYVKRKICLHFKLDDC